MAVCTPVGLTSKERTVVGIFSLQAPPRVAPQGAALSLGIASARLGLAALVIGIAVTPLRPA